MKISATTLSGVQLIELERISDDRGSFARNFCVDELGSVGVNFQVHQASISFNRKSGTLRGMHIQVEPSPEIKIVRCTRGAMFDVALDLRPDSSTYCNWVGRELTAENGDALLIPPGCAHGFQTLSDDTEVHYLMSGRYDPSVATGVRFDDSAFGIEWPDGIATLSEKDRSWPDFDPEAGLTVESVS